MEVIVFIVTLLTLILVLGLYARSQYDDAEADIFKGSDLWEPNDASFLYDPDWHDDVYSTKKEVKRDKNGRFAKKA